MKKVSLSPKDMDNAIVRAVCKKEGMGSFMPYRVIASSMRIAKEATIEVCVEECGEIVGALDGVKRPDAPRFIEDSVVHFLTKEEIFIEMAILVDMDKFCRKPCTFVQSTTPEIPEVVAVRLEYIPQGTLIKDCLPVFDGSL